MEILSSSQMYIGGLISTCISALPDLFTVVLDFSRRPNKKVCSFSPAEGMAMINCRRLGRRRERHASNQAWRYQKYQNNKVVIGKKGANFQSSDFGKATRS